MGSVSCSNLADGGVMYDLSFGRITLYPNHLKWTGFFNVTDIAYSDIISVSSSDGNFFIPASIQVNTAGRTYTIKHTANCSGFDYVANKIREKAAEVKRASLTRTTVTSADEIIRYKNLLDKGIITQSEFEAKKKQLLGL